MNAGELRLLIDRIEWYDENVANMILSRLETIAAAKERGYNIETIRKIIAARKHNKNESVMQMYLKETNQ